MKIQGFSLLEVLISLCIISGSALGLMQFQWQSYQSYNQTHLQNSALLVLDNTAENCKKSLSSTILFASKKWLSPHQLFIAIRLDEPFPSLQRSISCYA